MFGRVTILFFALFVLVASASTKVSGIIDCVEVRTKAPRNSIVKVWYRIPVTYDSTGRTRHPILVLFGGRNCDGRNEVSGKLGWTHWADSLGVFLIAPTFRDDDYWHPSKWSGAAMLEAIEKIAKTYRIEKKGFLYYGYSAGSQASNLFAAWKPELCRAWVSHACGVFHTPTVRTAAMPGLVTCGDADLAREWFAAIDTDGGQCFVWGEDDIKCVRSKDEIDVEFRNPLHSYKVLKFWQ